MTYDFDTDFNPIAYLKDYYPPTVGGENTEILQFYNEAFINGEHYRNMLEIGGGPTIYQLISAASAVDSIIFTDAVDANLNIIEEWQRSDQLGLWENYIKTSLECAGLPTDRNSILKRGEMIKEKLFLEKLNINSYNDVSQIIQKYGQFSLVDSSFCIDSITSSFQDWFEYVNIITSLVEPNGILILNSLGKSKIGYSVGKKKFPSVYLTEEDIISSLESIGFHSDQIFMRIIDADELHKDDYESLICIMAKKNNAVTL